MTAENVPDSGVTPPAAPPPADPPGDTGNDKDKDKFRGINKELQKAQAEAEELRKWKADQEAAAEVAEREKLAAQGEYKTLAEQADERAKKAEEELAGFRTRETARLETVAKSNKARLEALPEQFRVLVPEGLDADAVAVQLAKIEPLAGVKPPPVDVAGNAPRGAGPPDAAARKKQEEKAVRKAVFGDKEVISYQRVPGGDDD